LCTFSVHRKDPRQTILKVTTPLLARISYGTTGIAEEDASILTDTATMPPSRVPVVRPFDNSLDNDIRKDVVEKDRGHGLPAALVRKVTVEAGSLAKALLIERPK
jgi:hypothetical protein